MFLLSSKGWMGCGLVALAAAALVFFQGEEAKPAATQGGAAVGSAATAGTEQGPARSNARPLGERTTSAPLANPFSTALESPQRDAASAPAPSGQLAPPIPYAFAGRRDEGGRSVVVLARQGRLIAVRGPGMLDPSYEGEAIDERHVVLWHLPTMTRQLLPLLTPLPVAMHGAGASPADTLDPAIEQGN